MILQNANANKHRYQKNKTHLKEDGNDPQVTVNYYCRPWWTFPGIQRWGLAKISTVWHLIYHQVWRLYLSAENNFSLYQNPQGTVIMRCIMSESPTVYTQQLWEQVHEYRFIKS